MPLAPLPEGAPVAGMTTSLGGRGQLGASAAPAASSRSRWVVLGVLCVTLLLVSLDNTILNVALPVMERAMHATTTQLQWIVDAYAIVFAGLLLVAGSLGDRIGRQRVFALGLAVFAAGSAASAFSGSPDRLIAARAFMGIGAACIMPSTLSILANVFTVERERAHAIGIWSGTTGLGLAIGPVVGGWLLAHYWWGSVFLVNVPIAVVGLAATVLVVPNSKNEESKAADPFGALLSVIGMALLVWGIIESSNRTWTSPLVLGAVSLSLLVLATFAWWQRRCTHPMLEVSFFRSRRFSVAVAAMGMLIFSLMGALFLLTQYLQFSLGYTPLQTGLRIAPIAGVLLVVAPISAVLVRLVGTKPVVFTGMSLIALGLGLLSTTTAHGTYLNALPAFCCIGIGVGLAFAPCTESIMGSLPPEQSGVGSATNGTSLQIGGALGVAVLGSLLNTRYLDRLAPVLANYRIPKSVLALITGSLGVAHAVGGPLGAGLAAFARQSFLSGLDLSMTVGSVVVGVVAVAVILLLPNRSAQRERRDDVAQSVAETEERSSREPERRAG